MMSGRTVLSLRAILVAVLAAVVAGCAIGPNYKRPSVEVPATYRAEGIAPDAASVADVPWWDVFRDAALVGLIDEALKNNHDLRIAASRVEQARYAADVTRSGMLPQAGYQGDAVRARQFNPAGPANDTGNAFLGALQFAWEIDLWGRVRRSTEASLANLFAEENVRRGVILSLVTGVAQAYFELRELDLELEIARNTTESFRYTRDLFGRQLRGGVGTKLETSRAEAALAGTAATIPEIERQIVAKENQISILLGRPPGPIARGTSLTEQTYAPVIPPGLPAALLERRPDILQAEQNIVAANALIGVSIADFFPRIGLTSLYGGQSDDLDDIAKGSANIWSIGASLSGPIFTGGRLYYSYKGRVVAWNEAEVVYEKAVLNALVEVSNTLVAREKFAGSEIEQERQVAALRDSVRLSTLRYTGGLSSYFEVLDAQQQLFPAENALARTRLNRLVSVVQLYRALGGGWRAEEERRPEQYPLRREALDAIIPGTAPQR